MGNTIRTAISRRLTLCRETFILLSHFESTERIRGLSNLSKTIWIVKQESIHVFHSKSIQSLLGQLGVIFAILENIKGWLNGIWASPEFTCNTGDTGDMGLIPGPRRSPGGGHGNTLQYSCLESPMDRGAWRATLHRVTKSQMWLKQLGMCTHTHTHKRAHTCTHTHAHTRVRTHTHKENIQRTMANHQWQD